MQDIERIGAEWVADEIEGLTDTVEHLKPSDFNESVRYLPESVTSMPGYIRYSVNPYMREILDCFDIDSPVREVNLKKGGQITYTTVLESGILYYMAHVKTLPIMYITADKELAEARVENNIIPMLQQSGLAHIIRSSDIGNTRKTGKTKSHIQFDGGGYFVPFGARNADKMRSYSIAVMIKDEIDAWPEVVGKDGDPDALSNYRCKGYWERRKIFRGSTPVLKGSSRIETAYRRGDQRQYMVRCKACDFAQTLRWHSVHEKTGIIGGFDWELEEGTLIHESVCYRCQECGEPHYEHDKERLFSESGGARWVPTARPAEPEIRSYHLPAMYSPIGMQPWYACVADYLDAWDTENKRVKDIKKYQVFYNSVLGEPFEVMGAKIRFMSVSAHRRAVYRLGEIPNEYACEYSGGPILFLTCTVDVHKEFLQVAVMGWCRDARCYLISYERFESEDCGEITASAWQRLRDLIDAQEGRVFTADNGDRYRVALTFIDAGYANDTVTTFCGDYTAGVYPIVGRDRTAKIQRIQEFAEFTTQQGTRGYRVLVDYYKDRIGPVLRREWLEEAGTQPAYHFNAPIDTSDSALKELTREVRRQKTDPLTNAITYYWYRPGNARNELWDLLCYGHAAVEVLAHNICVQYLELETVDWAMFWQWIEGQPGVAMREKEQGA